MERDISNRILKSIGNGARRLFRNNVGTGWAGRVVKGPRTISLGASDVAVLHARPLNAGLCKGSSDLIGWTIVEITPAMVGRRVAVFTAIEVKTDTGRATGEQQNFIRAVLKAGGRAGVARDEFQAEKICDGGLL